MLNELFWQNLGDYNTEILGLFRDERASEPLVALLKDTTKNKIVADLGCGVGQAFFALRSAQRLYAVDSSKRMLDQAHDRAAQTAQALFLLSDLAEYSLPEQSDVSLLLASFFPDDLGGSLKILRNVQKNTKPGGDVIMVLPSMESLLYSFHLSYRHSFEKGVSEEVIHSKMREVYERILCYGYYHNTYSEGLGQVVKYWTKEELKDMFWGLRFKNIKFEKFILPWEVYFPKYLYGPGHEPLWLWQVTMSTP